MQIFNSPYLHGMEELLPKLIVTFVHCTKFVYVWIAGILHVELTAASVSLTFKPY